MKKIFVTIYQRLNMRPTFAMSGIIQTPYEDKEKNESYFLFPGKIKSVLVCDGSTRITYTVKYNRSKQIIEITDYSKIKVEQMEK